MVLQYIQHYLHTRNKQVAGCAQCASIDFLNVLHFVSARSGRMVLGYCIVHNVLLFLRSREWRVLVRIFSRRRRFRAGFSSLLGVLEVGSLLRMVTNDFECTRCNTHICTRADQNIRTYIYIYIYIRRSSRENLSWELRPVRH